MMQADTAELTSTVELRPRTDQERAESPAAETEVFEPSDESLHRSLPRNCALLAVTEDRDAGHFRLGFYFGGQYQESRDDDVRTQQASPLTLHRIAERGRWKEDHDELKNWWRELSRLRRWMSQLTTVADGRLIVWDNTSFQLPWELYYLDRGGWLGAAIEIVRWTSLLETGRETRYTAMAANASGGVLVLETTEVTARGGVARMAHPYRPADMAKSNAPLQTMDALLAVLKAPRLTFGLLLVHCLGINATNANEFRLAERTLNEIEQADMPALARTGAVVVLNACNSAKIVPVGPHSVRATRSFAEMFLRKGASTVIATLGQVGLDHAHEFAYRLLYADGAQRVSRFLLEHRRRYASRLTARPANDAPYEQFFYSFMYVCFGNPETTLEIIGSTAEEPDD